MVIRLRDLTKLLSITVVATCAVFVCALFLNYIIDLVAAKDEITSAAGVAMYEAQVSTGKFTSIVTGCSLVLTSAVMLVFYVKNYIDAHGRELGILKAIGYSEFRLAGRFWIFGLSVFLGCVLGYCAAYGYMPAFYDVQNADGLFPEIAVKFHPLLAAALIVLPTVVFFAIAVVYAYLRLKCPVLDLLREKREYKVKTLKEGKKERPFLKDLKITTLKGKKILVFFIAFSAFCFSAMTQMALSMYDLASANSAYMIMSIGLILAFLTLFMSLSTVVKGNSKSVAMLKAFGYTDGECSAAIFGGYRPVALIGFAVGTGYQYLLLKMVMTFIFNEIENVPEYKFDWVVMLITLAVFIVVYELVIFLYSVRIRKTSLKAVMAE